MMCYLQERQSAQAASIMLPSQQLSKFSNPLPQPPLLIEQSSKSFGFNHQTRIDNQVDALRVTENAILPETSQEIEPTNEVVPDLSDERLIAALLELVSERTGYPIDMIEPSLDLESDLGIDSIKRIEILNKFQGMLPATRRAEIESSLEELAGARTVNQIIESIQKNKTH